MVLQLQVIINTATWHSIRYLCWEGGQGWQPDFVFATPLLGSTGSVTQTYQYASLEPDEEWICGGSVWYRWTAPATGTEHFDYRRVVDNLCGAVRALCS